MTTAGSRAGPPAGADLAAALGSAREQGFVGRTDLLEWFDTAVATSDGERVLFLHGPGGIGKTSLLEVFARRAAKAGRPWVYLDARDVVPTASAVETALVERGGPADRVGVLLVDGYDLLTSLDGWFHNTLLPSRPADSVTVLAGRVAPAGRWWLDLGWSSLVRVHEMHGLDPADSAELLARLGVETPRREPLARLARGHPLALALLAETTSSGNVPAHLADAPDAVARLCDRVVDDIPDEVHRTGLQACAHANRMTHDLLRHVVGDRVDDVWSWLESRSYVRRGTVGLFLHDVVREAFEATFLHRSPDTYASLHRHVRDFFLGQVFDPTCTRPDRAAAEILLMHRRTPLQPLLDVLRQSGLPQVERAAVTEHAGVVGLVRQEEGPQAAGIASRWLAAQPNSLYRVLSDDGVAAFSMQNYLPVGDGLGQDDPVAVAIERVVNDLGPLRPGERINVNRFAGASRAYQREPATLLVGAVSNILEWALEPAAWSFIVVQEPDLYGPYFECLGLRRLFEVDCFGKQHVGFGFDRRRFPPAALFEMMARRELTGETGPPPESLLRPVPLSPETFTAAVVAALRQLTRPERLATSPLLTSGVMPPGAPALPELLQQVLVGAIGGLPTAGRNADLRRVLERTYLKGAPSQEAAAEMLGLPFSTYRRRLAQAHTRLVEVLWALETGVVAPPPGGTRRLGQELGRN